MMKKMLSLCLAVCLLLGCALSAGAEVVSYPLDGGNEPLTILMGVSMMAEGALNLSVALCALKIVRSRKPDEIEIELDEK